MNEPNIHYGLKDVYVTRTAISKIDGTTGTLSYRGINIENVAQGSFESALYLILTGRQATGEQQRDVTRFLKLAMAAMRPHIEHKLVGHAHMHPMQQIQFVLALDFPNTIPPDVGLGLGDLQVKGLVEIAKVAQALIFMRQKDLGQDILATPNHDSFLGQFLQCFLNRTITEKELLAFQIAQILQMEHGLNASTFAARVTTSTQAPLTSALSAAVGTLFGRLHGGADEASLALIKEIPCLLRAEEFIRDKITRGEKIMGMGHRVYRVVDPRAVILKKVAIELARESPSDTTLDMFLVVENAVTKIMKEKSKDIRANVEFYKAPVFYYLGIGPDYFTSLFAFARIAGYVAHIEEERKVGVIIRPKSWYIGA
ncbi:MAG: citrate/2-methylcitrate synthase [Pseudobacteriovorax sp.]|nr:citrate/2-methylcitrate synthase [Pseudobacteriovorax sp.]